MGDDDVFAGPGLSRWVIEIAREDVMWLRYVLEASEGVGLMSGGRDGVVTLVAPHSQRRQLEAILSDLAREMSLRVRLRPDHPSEG